MTDLSKVKHLLEWPPMRSAIDKEVRALLGPVRREKVDLQLKTVDEVDFRGYSRRRVNFFIDPWERVSAWLFIPDGKDETPGLLCCHQEVPQGKDEPAGLEGDSRMALAQHYAEAGYVTLCIDCATAGDRVSGRKPAYDTAAFYKDNPKASFMGKMLADHMAALDVFEEVKRVDTARLGVIGHGLGGANALLLAAFDDRVQACVASCGFTRFETDKNPEWWVEHEGMSLIPALQSHIAAKKYPFDWEHVLALAAPSAVLVMSTLSDAKFANPRSTQKAVTQAAKIYKLLGAGGALDYFGHHDGHRMTPESLEVADEWFERWL